ncbi:unnamed protein product [Rotaria sp. Silwood2]|nr:unnamed protein product [Rotaria sp. Silwood2]CAF3891801.1 unnamed protein product [Rotaria sp. Silwood2]CAF3976588.1 unnamed protein product [Rotaria sp. Silwood2]CAF4414564.1 unnamed protein product [Rotaria sp. Silwood2]
MEYAAVKALDMNVHCIPKSCTDSALSFLRSPFGQRLKNRDTFRIVTDMNRENEASHTHKPPLNVLAGYISPTHNSYVHNKLGDTAWIPAKDRCQLCEEAIDIEGSAVSSWMSVSRGESEWANGFVDFGPVTENLRDFLTMKLVQQEKLLKYPLRVVYVCGLDHFNKCLYVQLMAQQNNILCAVVYRHGYGEEHINQSDKTSGIIYIPLSKERETMTEISSPEIREYFQNPTIKNSNVEQNIHANVREYMRKKIWKKIIYNHYCLLNLHQKPKSLIFSI